MRHIKLHQYVFAATAIWLQATVSATAQVQELHVQRDTIPTYLKLQNKGIVNNALDVLNGNAAGLSVTSNGMDRMAQLSSVRVRGTTSIVGGNDPLVIIDGVTSDIATLSTIYPADIESFAVLKNAAETALYGSRDLVNWHLVWSSKDHYLRGFRGSPYKYFRIAGVATLNADENIFGASVQFTPRQNNQPR